MAYISVFYEIVDFLALDMYSKPIFCSKVAQKSKTYSRLPEQQTLLSTIWSRLTMFLIFSRQEEITREQVTLTFSGIEV